MQASKSQPGKSPKTQKPKTVLRSVTDMSPGPSLSESTRPPSLSASARSFALQTKKYGKDKAKPRGVAEKLGMSASKSPSQAANSRASSISPAPPSRGSPPFTSPRKMGLVEASPRSADPSRRSVKRGWTRTTGSRGSEATPFVFLEEDGTSKGGDEGAVEPVKAEEEEERGEEREEEEEEEEEQEEEDAKEESCWEEESKEEGEAAEEEGGSEGIDAGGPLEKGGVEQEDSSGMLLEEGEEEGEDLDQTAGVGVGEQDVEEKGEEEEEEGDVFQTCLSGMNGSGAPSPSSLLSCSGQKKKELSRRSPSNPPENSSSHAVPIDPHENGGICMDLDCAADPSCHASPLPPSATHPLLSDRALDPSLSALPSSSPLAPSPLTQQRAHSPAGTQHHHREGGEREENEENEEEGQTKEERRDTNLEALLKQFESESKQQKSTPAPPDRISRSVSQRNPATSGLSQNALLLGSAWRDTPIARRDRDRPTSSSSSVSRPGRVVGPTVEGSRKAFEDEETRPEILQRRVKALRFELDCREQTSERLRKVLQQAREREATALKEATAASLKAGERDKVLKAMDAVRQENSALKRRLTKLLDEKDQVERREEERARMHAEKVAKDTERSRDVWKSAEARRRESWEAEREKQSKEATLQSLEGRMRKMMAVSREERRQEKQDMQATLQRDKHAAMSKARSQLDVWKEETNRQCQEEISKVKDALQQRLQQQTRKHEAQVADLERRHREERAQLLREADKRRQDEWKEAETRIRNAREQARQAGAAEVAETEARLRDTQVRHVREMERMQEDMKEAETRQSDALRRLRESLEHEKKEAVEETIRRERKAKEREVEEVTHAMAAELLEPTRALQASHASEVAQLRAESEQWRRRAEEGEARVKQVLEERDREVEEITRSLASESLKQTRTVQSRAEEETAAWRRRGEMAAESAREAERRADVLALQLQEARETAQTLERRLAASEEALRRALAEEREESNAALRTVEMAVEREKATSASLAAEVSKLQSETAEAKRHASQAQGELQSVQAQLVEAEEKVGLEEG
uniref:Uncharacterized protein n=1 Tax=Chromera velia CCMP2878 TaxID=1169474 RepID=A0A0G4FB48_9ALVE|eukprot:Cvel_16123.t1-p1 / transcript=Cvel_16123.t1 / gene=Cvel_16123 / organism=Chromera_velia_CCMP2878 / gene_product=Trichohyalin, putative / transcript_product=Trichohyalin, putative / location=Cvel_scaffold1226:39490-47785(+) / protein_length=1051 / sequence_SO=supercontig / SO=protein_coding / is_pseudo=false